MAKKTGKVSAQAVKSARGGKAVQKRIKRKVAQAAKDKDGRVEELISLRREVLDATSVNPALIKRVLVALLEDSIVDNVEQ